MTLKDYFNNKKNKEIDNQKLHLFNTLGKKKELFRPLNPKEVGFYSCGPTVYHFAHIGNLRSYIFADILKRILKFNNYNVKHLMNITDVGHLANDGDDGEDKMVLGAKREKKSVQDIANFYSDTFKKDITSLNISYPSMWSKATDHIQDMIELIQKIEKNGFTYKANGNVYFDVMKYNQKYNYSILSNINLNEQDNESRVEIDPNKKSKFDFVLWFTKSKFGDQEQKWDSPYGVGYPGWHIECSAMSTKYLGEEFDIHSGGVDHIPVHHTNEIAQCMAATGKMFSKYWMHGEFLVINKGKMAKSGSNFITLDTLKEKGYEPLTYRYFCLNSHYKQQLNFSYEALDGAKNGLNRLKKRIIELKNKVDLEESYKLNDDDKKVVDEYIERFVGAINDDLNMPIAFSIVSELLKDLRIKDNIKLYLLYQFDNVYGLDFKNMNDEIIDIPQDVLEIAKQRQEARNNKDWKKSDELRDLLKEKGYISSDKKDNSYELKKI